jgi:shikimate dehydrogenase
MVLTETHPIDDHTRLVGWIGWPTEPWSALAVYNAAFDYLGMNWRCLPLTVPETGLREALRGLQALGFAGAVLAEPFQREAANYIGELSHAAETIGIVNHVRVDEHGRLVGDNINWLGFLATLRAVAPSLNGLRPLVIGAGVGARAIVYALTGEGLPLTVVDEQMERAVDLVHRLRRVLDEHSFSVYRWPQDLEQAAQDVNVIINTPSAGALPDSGRSPWPDELPFPRDALAFDLASWPGETRFLQQARASGARTVCRLPLAVNEAGLAFEKWTGHPPPVEAMRRVIDEVLLSRTAPGETWPQTASLSLAPR